MSEPNERNDDAEGGTPLHAWPDGMLHLEPPPMMIRAVCAVHKDEHEYTEAQVVTLIETLSNEDYEDGPRCPLDVLRWRSK